MGQYSFRRSLMHLSLHARLILRLTVESAEREGIRRSLDALVVSGYYLAGNRRGSAMERVHRLRRELFFGHTSKSGWRMSASLFCLAFVICVVALLAAKLQNFDLSSLLLGVALATLCIVAFFLARFLSEARTQERLASTALDTTEASLLESEERFRQMAENIQEIFWMIDVEPRQVLD